MGVKDLDMQYMLGDSILVAPIFREDSMGEFYLPEGTWTHLLSGERREEEDGIPKSMIFFSAGICT